MGEEGTLLRYVKWFNEEMGSSPLVGELDVAAFGESLGESIRRHFVTPERRNEVSISNLGYPAVVTALRKLGYREREPVGKVRFIFHMGDFFESFVEHTLPSAGLKVLSSQGVLDFEGIPGHYDFIVEDSEGREFLLECKTMSDGYARRFMYRPDDERGYVTQLSLYSYSYARQRGLDEEFFPAAWLCLNKGTSEVFIQVPDTNDAAAALERARAVVRRLEKVRGVEDVLKYFRVPPCREEIYQRQTTGKLLPPPSMAYSPFLHVFYRTYYATDGYNREKLYVERPSTQEEMLESLERLLDEGVIVYKKV